MKKKVFITIESLVCAGAEKSLITFLSVLDYNRFDVDLQLFAYGGEFEEFIPKEVNLLPPFEYTNFLQKSTIKQFLSGDLKKICARWSYSLAIRKGVTYHADKARLYHKHVFPCLPETKEYDIAIGYAQGLPTFYVADKVKAKQKFCWVNVSYKLEGTNLKFQRQFYEKMTNIVTVSDSAYDVFTKVYPEFAPKMVTIWDMLEAKFIHKLSMLNDNTGMDKTVPCLLTVARLNKPQKGYDIALEACKILRDRGIKFKWYALGRGDYRPIMEEYIAKNHLENTFILLGTTPNPYPYFRDCTLYVQTSRHEGYGLSIAEGRILNKPVVTTEFDAVLNQMVPGKNGLVVKQNPVDVADAIEKLLTDKALYDSIKAYLENEKKGNPEEIEKFYKLIEE